MQFFSGCRFGEVLDKKLILEMEERSLYKNLIGIAEFLLSLVTAWVISFLFFDKDQIMILFFFVLLYGGRKGTNKLSPERANLLEKILVILSVLGVVLIVIGNKVLCNDIMVIVGAMLFVLIIPVIVKAGIDVIHRRFMKEKR